MIPNLASYDVILVNSSAGKDSQAMLDYVVEQAEAAGVVDRIVVVHADLGRVEWKGVKELAREHAEHYDVRFEIVKRPQGDLLDHVRKRGMWPSPTERYCTSDHKRGQIQTLVTRLHRESGKKQFRLLNCLGFRAEESDARAKRKPYVKNERASTNDRTVDDWLPIHTWKEATPLPTVRCHGDSSDGERRCDWRGEWPPSTQKEVHMGKVKSAFATNLRALREAAKLSQADLAQRAGLSSGHVIYQLESELRRPTWDTACRLANALGVKVDALR